MTYGTGSAVKAYQSAGAHGRVAEADPHRLVQLLLEGALDRLAIARGHLQAGRIPQKGETLSRAIAIVDSLNAHLDLERGGEIAANLRGLYDYATRRLLEANLRNDAQAIDEVAGLLREVKAGWDAIGAAARTPQ
ncbi:MAG: flagellar export chaperone FliS [Steroidobacteraceae bacterium]|jgi:flagellar protein FliS|nr:flagellar export chaperone FliS [Steroidobacteraceae bacterium]